MFVCYPKSFQSIWTGFTFYLMTYSLELTLESTIRERFCGVTTIDTINKVLTRLFDLKGGPLYVHCDFVIRRRSQSNSNLHRSVYLRKTLLTRLVVRNSCYDINNYQKKKVKTFFYNLGIMYNLVYIIG